MDDRTLADLIDSAVRHAHGEGPQPDLTALPSADRDEALDVLQLVDALAFAEPPEGELQRVLGRLHSIRTARRAIGVRSFLNDLAAEYGGAVSITETDEPLPIDGMRALFECYGLAEHLLIVSAPADVSTGTVAQPLFDRDPTLTGVMLYELDTGKAAIVDSASCRTRIVPGHGITGPAPLQWTDPDVALRRRFAEVFPDWGRIDRLHADQSLGAGIEEALEQVAEMVYAEIARSRPCLSHKQAARDFLTDGGPRGLITLANEVRSRRISAEETVERVASICRGGTS